MLWLAHDGSLNSDWLSHYALRCARHMADKAIQAVFVEDGSVSTDDVRAKFARLARRCDAAGVAFSSSILEQEKSVAQTLLHQVTAGRGDLLLCGTRVKRRTLGFLRGTVSERLLREAPFRVLALRIVSPGLLGMSRNLLLPVMGRPEGPGPALPLLQLLAPELEQVFVLSVHPPTGARLWDRVTSGKPAPNPRERRRYVSRTKAELEKTLGRHLTVDHATLASNDPAGEIVLAAKQHHCQLILLGATQRPLAERMVVGTPAEKVLRYAPCDVGIYGGGP